MDTGMAALAEGDEILGRIVRPVTVPVVDVEILLSAAEPAPVFVPCQNVFSELFPFLQAVFVPHRDHDIVATAEEGVVVALCIRTGVAETPVGVQSGHVPAGRDTSVLK
jgi:hypothetical protein